MLTDKQREIVTENHNLIYWIMSIKHLNQDWYDLLAIELCKTVRSFKEEKGSLSTYYKKRCDNMISNQLQKESRLKRVHVVASNHDIYKQEDVDAEIDHSYTSLCDWIENDDSGILKLKASGYSQSEISSILGVSQSFVSRKMKQLRKEYYDTHDR